MKYCVGNVGGAREHCCGAGSCWNQHRLPKRHGMAGLMQKDGTGVIGMQRSRAWCGTPSILGVVNMVGTRNFTCYMGAL